MSGSFADKKVMEQHDKLVQGLPDDLKAVLEGAQQFQDKFAKIHAHAEQISRTAFDPVGQQARKLQPSHLVEHIDAVHAHAIDLAKSTMPGVQRHDMTPLEVQSQHDSIAGIRALVEQNLNHLTDIRRHLDEFRKKLERLEDIYS